MKNIIKKYKKEYPDKAKKTNSYLVECIIDSEIAEFLTEKEVYRWIKEIKEEYGHIFELKIICRDKKGHKITEIVDFNI